MSRKTCRTPCSIIFGATSKLICYITAKYRGLTERKKDGLIILLAFLVYVFLFALSDIIYIDWILIAFSILFSVFLISLARYNLIDIDGKTAWVTLQVFALVFVFSSLNIISFAFLYKTLDGSSGFDQDKILLYDSAQYFMNTGAVGSGVEKENKIAHIIESLIGYSLIPVIISVIVYKISSLSHKNNKS